MASLFARNAALTASRASRSLRPAMATKAAFVPMIQSKSFSQSLQRLEKRFTESHEWIDVAADGKTCKIGITEFAAEALGEVVYVELPEVNDEVTGGEGFGSVESVKSASDIVSPVSGVVKAVNEPITSTPADLSTDPEGESWLIEIEAEDVSAVEGLMNEEAYKAFAAEDH